METRQRLISLPFPVEPLPGILRLQVPPERLHAVLSDGCLGMLKARSQELQMQIQIICNGNVEKEIGEPSVPKPQSEPDIYGQYDLPFRPTVEQVEQFIVTQQASDRIVTMLDIGLAVPRFVRITPNQAWERNAGGGSWSMGDWFNPDRFLYIWRESMVPASRRRISEQHTLQTMEERLDPEAGNISLDNYEYCCTAPNGDVRVYRSDVRLMELPFGANPNDLHLVRMMVSDRGAWDNLFEGAK